MVVGRYHSLVDGQVVLSVYAAVFVFLGVEVTEGLEETTLEGYLVDDRLGSHPAELLLMEHGIGGIELERRRDRLGPVGLTVHPLDVLDTEHLVVILYVLIREVDVLEVVVLGLEGKRETPLE